jgi:hypothetical protein
MMPLGEDKKTSFEFDETSPERFETGLISKQTNC